MTTQQKKRPWWNRLLPRTGKPYRISRWYVCRHINNELAGGPFKGMRYVAQAVGSAYYGKLLGTYECELEPVMARIAELRYDRIINVGAAEGYYAVGLARQHPEAHVLAFEAEEKGQQLIRQLAEVNNVADRVEVAGFCGVGDLQKALTGAGRTLVVMDVEGAERDLLDPQTVEPLRSAEVLVEIHDDYSPGVGDLIAARFADTHNLTEIHTRDRTVLDVPQWLRDKTKLVPKKYFIKMMRERRPWPMRWFYLAPRKD